MNIENERKRRMADRRGQAGVSVGRIYEDDTEICNEPKERLEESLERWRYALGRRGRTVSTSKTEWMCVSIGER